MNIIQPYLSVKKKKKRKFTATMKPFITLDPPLRIHY